jgi:hypothetical protein
MTECSPGMILSVPDRPTARILELAMRFARWIFTLLAAVVCAGNAAAMGGEGLKARADESSWSRWQGRLSLGTAAPTWRASLTDSESVGLRVNSATLTGDYYLSRGPFERVALGGLRATSALIVGPRTLATTGQPTLSTQGSGFTIERRLAAQPAASELPIDMASLPYLGLGYTGLSARSKWSFNADLGLVALHPGNVVRLGKVVGGNQSLDDVLRDLRLAPVFQMGVSYSF